MTWIIIPIVLVVVMSIYSFMNYKNAKNQYLNEPDTLIAESEPLKNKVLDLVKQVQPNLENTILVNGHFTKQVSVGIKVTTFYSYAILLNTLTNQLQVISYSHDKNTSQDAGFFTKSSVEAIDVNKGAQTNYLFKDENGKTLFTVQTTGHEMPMENEYQIKYFQEENYNKLRSVFNLAPFVMAEQLQGGK